MLVLYMRMERLCRHMSAAVFALDLLPLPLVQRIETLLIIVVHFLQERSPNFPWDTTYIFGFGGIRTEVNALEQTNQDIKRGLQCFLAPRLH